MNHIVYVCDTLLYRELHFRVVSIQVLCDFSRRLEIGTPFETDREGSDLPEFTGRDGRDETAIETTREKKTNITVCVIESVMNGIFECMSDLELESIPDVLIHTPVSGVITHKVVDVRIVHVTRWENVYFRSEK